MWKQVPPQPPAHSRGQDCSGLSTSPGVERRKRQHSGASQPGRRLSEAASSRAQLCGGAKATLRPATIMGGGKNFQSTVPTASMCGWRCKTLGWQTGRCGQSLNEINGAGAGCGSLARWAGGRSRRPRFQPLLTRAAWERAGCTAGEHMHCESDIGSSI